MAKETSRTALGGRIGIGNLKHTISMIATQLKHHKQAQGVAANGYLKLAIVLVGSCAETLVYRLVCLGKKYGKEMPMGSWEYTHSQALPKNLVTKKGGQVVVCRRQQKRIKLNPKIEFKKLNTYARQMGLIDGKVYSRLEEIRDMRNRIHLSGLTSVDRHYRLSDVEEASEIIIELLDLIEDKRIKSI